MTHAMNKKICIYSLKSSKIKTKSFRLPRDHLFFCQAKKGEKKALVGQEITLLFRIVLGYFMLTSFPSGGPLVRLGKVLVKARCFVPFLLADIAGV
jgi:hypothetical protein